MRLKISVSSNQIPLRLTVKVNRFGMERRGECGNDILNLKHYIPKRKRENQ